MALTSTSALSVNQVISPSTTGSKVTFMLAPVAPLWIGSVAITNSPTGHFSGNLTAGTDAIKHTGKVAIYVDAAAFADIRAHAVMPFQVIVSYNTNTFEVVELELVRDLTVLSRTLADAVAAAIKSASLPAQAAE